jgi:hypothetical protein
MLSTCCGAPPWMSNWHYYAGEYHGMCSECKEHTEFYDEEDEDD